MTEARATRRAWSPRRTPVRTRIAAGVSALTAISLVLVGLALYAVEARRIDRSIQNALLQEVAELRSWAERADAEGVAGPDAVLTSFLARNTPDAREMLWSFPSTGRPQYTGEPDARLQRSTEFADAVESLRTTGGTRSITVEGTDYRLAVQPITDGTITAAFVVTHDVTATRSELRSLLTTYGLLAAIALLAITAVAARLAGRLLRPLHDLRASAQSVSAQSMSGQSLSGQSLSGQSLSGGGSSARLEVVGHDDVAELQRTFNAMLDRVESAFAEQRRLLDDAAHELRTPLTVLRGHLEVVDAGDPADVAATRDLLLDEIDRMARLVGDLLMLARSARPDFVRPEPTDVAALTTGALERVRALGARTWTLDDVAEVEASVDAQRLTQALLQLADNARKHTSPGDTIALGSRIVPGALELWVRDTGAGIDPAVAGTLFERFSRAPGAVMDGGFGLGLSIVHAIAAAHGGSVRVDPVPVGARLTIVLPLVLPLHDPTPPPPPPIDRR